MLLLCDLFVYRHAIAFLIKEKIVSNVEEAIHLCNVLIEYNLIRHSTGEHWMKNLDLPYYFTGVEPLFPPISPYYSFLKAHIVKESALTLPIRHNADDYDGKYSLIQKALEEEYPLYYDISVNEEEYHNSSFAFPIVFY